MYFSNNTSRWCVLHGYLQAYVCFNFSQDDVEIEQVLNPYLCVHRRMMVMAAYKKIFAEIVVFWYGNHITLQKYKAGK